MTLATHSDFDWLIGILPARRPVRVLDLGCADCPEGEALVAAGERFVVTASEPVPRPTSPGPPLPAGVVRWDGDDEAEVCDARTGTCGPAGGTTKSRLEEDRVTRS